MSATILIIDDDRELCALLTEFLQLEGFSASSVHDGAAAVAHCRDHRYDAIVLDVMLPGLQGLEVLRSLRKFSTTPVLMLTARGEDTDRIVGLEMGADDYLPKPCNPRELAARLRAILRRSGGTPDVRESSGAELVVGDTRLDTAARIAEHGGIDLQLTAAEFNILQVLLAQAGTVVDKDSLCSQALGRELTAYDRSVDVHISKLRRKLATAGGDRLIVSVRGSGYQFTVNAGEKNAVTPRIPLFGKIFLGFWLVTIVVFASWLLTSRYFDSGPDRGAVEHRSKEPPQRFILQMVYELQNLDEAELQPLLARASAKHDVDIFLLDEGEVDILGRAVPDKVSAVARKLRPPGAGRFSGPAGEHLFAQQIYRPDHGMLRAVFVFRPSRHQFLRLLGSNLWLRTGLTILISGVICYLLSRLLTNRIKTLQAASRQLATGHLDTRLRVRERGGDETDELARDFNSMAQQLQERIGAQKRLLTDVSHELRSPLARLRIALALAQEKPEKLPDYLQRMERETERLEALIDQLLRSQGEALELDSHIDLVALLRQLCDDANFEGAAQGKRLLLQHDFPQAMVESSGDLLHKSFENILRNALAHTREHTEVNVSITGDRDSYQVCVTDHGGGIPEQELDKIFEAFYRTDVARSRDTGGFGLGLAIARRAILRHGGQVSAVNTKTGLAVTVTLPRNRPPQEA